MNKNKFDLLEVKKACWDAASKLSFYSDLHGLMLTGSYAVGNFNINSDVDLVCTVDKNNSFFEKGFVKIGSYNVSYNAMSLDSYAKEIERQFYSRSKILARNFAKGVVFHDADGQLSQLKQWATTFFRERIPDLSEQEKISLRYQIHLICEKINTWDTSSSFFSLEYFTSLHQVLFIWFRFEGVDLVPPAKLERFFTKTGFRELFKIEAINTSFSDIFLTCLSQSSDNGKLLYLTKLLSFVQVHLGSIDTTSYVAKYSE